MISTVAELSVLAAEANLAPSVHNTQPTRWRLEADGEVLVLEDTSRRLRVGDPAGRDAAVSHGAAIEGFALACNSRGVGVEVEPLDLPEDRGLRPVARLRLSPGGQTVDRLRAFVTSRRTYRGVFVRRPAATSFLRLEAAEDVRLVRDPKGVARLAALNDVASLGVFRDRDYRAELVSWMRFSRQHPRWAVDGLNAEAMAMSGPVAAVAGLVLKPNVFEALDRIAAARLVVAEAPVVTSAEAIVLFHRPDGENPLRTGRRFYRLWLELAELGLSAAPMAVLADDAPTRAIIAKEFQIADERRLITAFRVGAAPARALSPKPRLPAEALLA